LDVWLIKPQPLARATRLKAASRVARASGCGFQPRLAQGRIAEEKQSVFAGQSLGRGGYPPLGNGGPAGKAGLGRSGPGFGQLQVVGQNHGGALARAAGCSGDRLGHVAGHASGAVRAPDPAGNRPGQTFDVAGQGRVGLGVPGGMLADQVNDGCAGTLGVVQVRDAVGKAGTEM